MLRGFLVFALLALVGAAPAGADPPGNWTGVKRDAFRHWACKQPGKGDRLRVRTASSSNGDANAVRQGIGIWAVLTRGGNKAYVSQRNSEDWDSGWIFTTLRGAREDDRVWVQGAYYGPTEPWSDGIRVGRLARCAT